jgi:hypothetical protein
MALARKNRLSKASKSSTCLLMLCFGMSCDTLMTVMQTPIMVAEDGRMWSANRLFWL